MSVLIIEDKEKDLVFALGVARDAGFRRIDVQQSLGGAKTYLEKSLRGEQALPDAILLDLGLGQDSGYELLRLRYLSPDLMKARVIVWSEYDEHNSDVCRIFKADAYVGKWTGAAGLRQAMAELHLPRQHDLCAR